MALSSESTSRSRAGAWMLILVLGLFAVTLGLQWQAGAYRSEFGAHSDEPAHVVTGLMIRDYLADGLIRGEAPMSFAQNYYERYPKVALGHYPPAFYLVEGLWLLPVRSPAAVLVMMALMCAVAALLTWLLASSHGLSPTLAWVPAALFVIHPLVRTYTSIVMSDLLLVIFCLLAVDAWRRFLGSKLSRHSLLFGLWAAAAILTKGSGLFLALVPLLSIALSGKWSLLKCRALWLAPIPVLLFAFPWMLATRHITEEGMSATPLAEYLGEAVAFFVRHIPGEFGWLASALLIIVVIDAVIRTVRRKPVSDSAACLIALALGLLLLYLVVPAGLDVRYLLPLVPAVFILSIDAVSRTATRLIPTFPQSAVIAVAVVAGSFVIQSHRPVNKQFSGYSAAVDAIIADSATPSDGEWIDVLVASDSHGEGAAVVAAAFRREAPLKIHRSTKVLIKTDWLGRDAKPLSEVGEPTWRRIRELGIDWILIDDLSEQPQVTLLRQSLPEEISNAAALHPMTTKAEKEPQIQRMAVNR